MVDGYAVRNDTGILIDTVFASRRGAMTIWLQIYEKIPVEISSPEKIVSDAFAQLAPKRGAKLVAVKIVEAK